MNWDYEQFLFFLEDYTYLTGTWERDYHMLEAMWFNYHHGESL